MSRLPSAMRINVDLSDLLLSKHASQDLSLKVGLGLMVTTLEVYNSKTDTDLIEESKTSLFSITRDVQLSR